MMIATTMKAAISESARSNDFDRGFAISASNGGHGERHRVVKACGRRQAANRVNRRSNKAGSLLQPPMEQSSAEAVSHLDTSRQEDIMNKIAISLAVGATALFATAAAAAPLTVNPSVAPDSNIQNVRMVCNENGRCWRERGERRVIIRDSYGYDAPRERYIERRGYEERGGIGFRAPGVSVGIGTDRY
jgi:hypothetical protein